MVQVCSADVHAPALVTIVTNNRAARSIDDVLARIARVHEART
jgi:hypothetical protein